MEIRRPLAGRDRKSIEVPKAGRDFATQHRSEPFLQTDAPERLGEIDQLIVFGGNGQLDPFSGQSQDSLFDGGVAVPRVGEGVDVSIATGETWRGNFASN